MKDTIVVNIFGAPGSGKSTGAAYIFSKLKMLGVDAELATEVAKDKVWENNQEPFRNQAYLFGNQSYRLSRCAGKVEVIVTDSPLPLSIHYNHDERLTENFDKTVLDVFNSYHNMNYFLHRAKEYNPNGRHQSEQESDTMAGQILNLLDKHNISVKLYRGIEEHYNQIIDEVYQEVINKRRGLKDSSDSTNIEQ